MVNSVSDFEDECSKIRCMVADTALRKFQDLSCECVHNARIKQYEGEIIRDRFTLWLLIGFILILAIVCYFIGLTNGAYYAATFGTGGCYESIFWDSDCEVIF